MSLILKSPQLDLPHSPEKRRVILGVPFFTGSSEEAARAAAKGGLVVVPSAPGLMEVVHNKEYREAARDADFVLTDSAFMVIVWLFLTGERLPRTSGLRYLRLILFEPAVRQSANPLWIMPSLASARKCIRWLQSVGFPAT